MLFQKHPALCPLTPPPGGLIDAALRLSLCQPETPRPYVWPPRRAPSRLCSVAAIRRLGGRICAPGAGAPRLPAQNMPGGKRTPAQTPSNAARKLSLFPGLLPLAGGATVRPALRSEASRLAAVPPAPLASGLARPSLPTTPPGLPLHLPLSALLPQATAHHSPSPQPPLDPGSLPRPARPSSLAATAISAL